MKKRKLEILLSVLATTLFIISCNYNVAPNISSQETPSVISVTVTPFTKLSILTHQETLKQMYGKDLDIPSKDEAVIRSAEGVKYNIEINVFSCYWDASNSETCLVITDRSQCMGCVSYIDGAIFNRLDGDWKIRSFNSNIANFELVRKAPKGEIVQIGNNNYAVQFRWWYSSTGSTLEHLVLVGDTGMTNDYSFGVLLNVVSMGERWISANKREGWTTNLYFQRTEENKKYDDLFIDYYGDNIEMPYSEFYTFSDGKYILAFKKSY